MWIIFTVVILLIIWLFLISPALRKHPDKEIFTGLHIAHRGLHDTNTPENSISAFKKAIECGFAIEIDIHVTKDDRIVIFHDDNLKRVCGEDKHIESMTLDELSRYRLLDTDEKIPTLEQLLDICSKDTVLVIEYKCTPSNYKRLCENADRVLSRYNVKYIVQSFNPLAMYWFKKNKKEICRGQLATDFIREEKKGIIEILCGFLLFNFISRPDFISYDIKYPNVPQRKICIMLGALTAGWTVKSQKELDNCKKRYDAYIFEDFIPIKIVTSKDTFHKEV